ncbi:uncharacterized protein LOC106071137 [Biomphalaria glabrata]|uniref:Uncharacterized protein LOC106071137 n=1 Tax=Biomphalaria glabrata TaxID=6526 RepID=A0A9W3AL37_BIOGL|nr:uncharacterized protein LOC106071137 [Biomphalaria glabrata]XP_055887975.1 uncharacterized protein LOC106071137 [Biomphalaria glabrata]XP_055887977.1 uncharacterized protein LOC106071137 [Biomphalaria glabrata]
MFSKKGNRMKTRSSTLIAMETAETEESDSRTESLNETEIHLLNEAGFSVEVLNQISHEEKLEILRAISESRHHPTQSGTQEESHMPENSLVNENNCHKRDQIVIKSNVVENTEAENITVGESDSNSDYYKKGSKPFTETSDPMEGNSRSSFKNSWTNKLKMKLLGRIKDCTNPLTNAKKQAEQNNDGKVSRCHSPSLKKNVDQDSSMTVEGDDEDTTQTYISRTPEQNHAQTNILGSNNCSTSVESTNDARCEGPISPLFKAKLLNNLQTKTVVLLPTASKSLSLWSFLRQSKTQINPDQYTEIVKLVYDIYFRRLQREQKAMKQPANKWGRPVVPGPHIEGCLLAQPKKYKNKVLRLIHNNRDDDENNLPDLKREGENQSDKTQKKHNSVSRKDSKTISKDMVEYVEHDEFELIEEEESENEFEIYREEDFTGNSKKLRTNHSSVIDGGSNNLKVIKRKIESSGTGGKRKTHRKLLSEKDIHMVDQDSPELDSINKTVVVATPSKRIVNRKKLNSQRNLESVFVWSCDDSSESETDNIDAPYAESASRHHSKTKANDILVIKSASSPTFDILENADTLPPDFVENTITSSCPQTKSPSSHRETCADSENVRLSQESASCLSNSQSSNSLLDANGDLYSTQITCHRRKLKKLDSTVPQPIPQQNSVSLSSDLVVDTASAAVNKKYQEGKALNVNLTGENVMENTSTTPNSTNRNVDQPQHSLDSCKDMKRNYEAVKSDEEETDLKTSKPKRTKRSKDLSKKSKKKSTTTPRKLIKNPKKESEDSDEDVICSEISLAGPSTIQPESVVEKKYACPICGEHFNEEKIEEHASNCGDEQGDQAMISCSFCHVEMTSDVIRQHEVKCSLKRKTRIMPSRTSRDNRLKPRESTEPLLVSDGEDYCELIIEAETPRK